jgi:hypothetical protein
MQAYRFSSIMKIGRTSMQARYSCFVQRSMHLQQNWAHDLSSGYAPLKSSLPQTRPFISVYVCDLHAEYLSMPTCWSPSASLPSPQWCIIADLLLEKPLVKPDLAALCFNANITVPRLTSVRTSVPPVSFPSLNCTLLVLLSMYDHQLLLSLQLLRENNRPWRSKPCWPLDILDVEAYISWFMHKESFAGNLSSSVFHREVSAKHPDD